ncbi:glutaredoxin family protein [Agaribacterium haliotis]|uniref:glutaredoxin family protein n=1 Tax=Agaribacterium haliotis TaxID=2013869 RepID=UPI000BB56B9D|nr:glutaredoxin family protein [Agaribacterium haliotis]
MNNTDIILYRSCECPLCDDAMALWYQSDVASQFKLRKKDVTSDKDLMLRYAKRIPVLKTEHSTRELAWPFSLQELNQWLASGLK